MSGKQRLTPASAQAELNVMLDIFAFLSKTCRADDGGEFRRIEETEAIARLCAQACSAIASDCGADGDAVVLEMDLWRDAVREEIEAMQAELRNGASR